MDIKQFLDSTYLKTAEQAGLSTQENRIVAMGFVQEAIAENFKLIMLRPEYVSAAKEMIATADSRVSVGTVIDFPQGNSTIAVKLDQARMAISDGADDLDFVINYEAFKSGDIDLVKDEVLQGTRLVLDHSKTVKWIIETAALESHQIVQLCALIKNVVLSNFTDTQFSSVFVKSSTGFYKTDDGRPNGATIQSIMLMLENAAPLPVKASGGVRSFDDAVAMINLGVKRIGTSVAKSIADNQPSDSNY